MATDGQSWRGPRLNDEQGVDQKLTAAATAASIPTAATATATTAFHTRVDFDVDQE